MQKGSLSFALLGAALAAIGLACDASNPSERASAESRASGDRTAAEALDAALAEPDPYARVRRLAELLPTLGPEAVPAVRERLRRVRVRPAGAELELLVRFWASHEPRAAARWAYGLIAGPAYKTLAVATAVELWARADPEAALAGAGGAAQAFTPDVANSASSALVTGWFHADREAAETYIQGLGTGKPRQRAILAYALALAQAEGGEAVMRWAEGLPDDDLRYKRNVFRQVTWALAWFDPQVAERWCDAHCDGSYGGGMRRAIARARINSGEGGAVMEWVALAPETEENDTTLRSTYGIWALRDREAALAWLGTKLEQEEPEPWVRKLYGSYAKQLSATAPGEAIEWAARFEGPEATREELMVRIARRWLLQDREAAEAWLRDSPLSEEARARARAVSQPHYLPEAPDDLPETPDAPELTETLAP